MIFENQSYERLRPRERGILDSESELIGSPYWMTKMHAFHLINSA